MTSTAIAQRIDGVLAQLRDTGGRVTAGRRAIVRALFEAPSHHVTAQTLTDAVQAESPEISTSTIYRTLDTLTELGVVEQRHVGTGPTVFHLTEHAHDHVVCTDCGRILEIPRTVFANLTKSLRAQFDFELHPEHVALSGVCAQCRRRHH